MIPEQRPPEALSLSRTLGGQEGCGRPTVRRNGRRFLVGERQGPSIHISEERQSLVC